VSALKICPQCGTEYELDQRFCPKDGSTLKTQGGQTGDLVGSIIADRYNVLKKLGEGGMGTVYLAEHVKMGRKSALKVMNPGMVHDADAISRFNREAANASRINHANVAAVYDFGETSEGLIYLAMEFVEGPALTKIIEELGALPPVRAAEITRQAAEALAVAHDMGIVHRDLKPDNIMIAKNRDGSDCVKVVDFGIAKAAADDKQKVTKTGLVVGTPEYMSPEQLAGDKLDGRSDTYSLALVAFAMFTGKLPFPAETVQESMILRLTDQPKRLHEMKGDIQWPPAVQQVMDKALERDAAARYQSAAEFGRSLHKAVMSMPEAALTNAFTSVMGRMSTPKAPAPVVPGRQSAGATKAMPQTRVNPATPVGSPAIEPPRVAQSEKSKTGLYAGIGVGVLALVATAVLVPKFTSGGGNASTANGTTADQLSKTVTPAVVVDSAPIKRMLTLKLADSLSDLNKNATYPSAMRALAILDTIAPQVSADSDSVYVDYLRAQSHFALSYLATDDATTTKELKTACALFRKIEPKSGTRAFGRSVRNYLSGDGVQPAMCK
jgi:eukaryotic-like serine/threonine-protein kinase